MKDILFPNILVQVSLKQAWQKIKLIELDDTAKNKRPNPFAFQKMTFLFCLSEQFCFAKMKTTITSQLWNAIYCKFCLLHPMWSILWFNDTISIYWFHVFVWLRLFGTASGQWVVPCKH